MLIDLNVGIEMSKALFGVDSGVGAARTGSTNIGSQNGGQSNVDTILNRAFGIGLRLKAVEVRTVVSEFDEVTQGSGKMNSEQ